jgi:hypothetical protein
LANANPEHVKKWVDGLASRAALVGNPRPVH